MRRIIDRALLLIALVPVAAAAQDGTARPTLVLRQAVSGMPREATQELRVLTATFKPGDRTVTHTHRFPVTVYVLEGAFTLHLEGHDPVTVRAGEALVEPPNVTMTGFNRSADTPTRVVIFYASALDTPFLDAHHATSAGHP